MYSIKRCHSFSVILWPMLPFLLDFQRIIFLKFPGLIWKKCNDHSTCFWLTNLDCSLFWFFFFFLVSLSQAVSQHPLQPSDHPCCETFSFCLSAKEMSRFFPGSVRTKASFCCSCTPLRPRDLGVEPNVSWW